MLNKKFIKCMAIFMLSLMLPKTGLVEVAYGAMVNIPIGTRVLLKVEENLSPETKGIGDKVILSVVNDVIIEGKTIIDAGAPALGEITTSTKEGVVGAPGEIAYKAIYVTAVDDQNVMLEGSTKVTGKSKMAESIIITLLCCIFALLMKGQKAEIKQGNTLSSMTISPNTIEVK